MDLHSERKMDYGREGKGEGARNGKDKGDGKTMRTA